MKNTIYLRRKFKVIVEPGQEKLPLNYISTLLKNIETIGFTFSGPLIERLTTVSIEDLKLFYKEITENLQFMVGSHNEFNPMYPNFPGQVMEMEKSELYINAILHYLGDVIGTRILPEYVKENREPLRDNIKLKIIGLGTEEDFRQIFRNLLGSKTSISQTDKEDLKWSVLNYGKEMETILPNEMPNKENLTYLAGLMVQYTDFSEKVLSKFIKTATDVLRLATALSDGDMSLSENTRFRKFKRKERKLLLGLLENCHLITEDMLRYKKRWMRLGEILHPGEFKDKYPKSFDSFYIIRNDVPFKTFNNRVEKFLSTSDVTNATDLLQTRPGELARKLDHLLRLENSTSEENSKKITGSFNEVADSIATPVLLQVMKHFKYRNEDRDLRIFFPKGKIAKVRAIENKLPKISQEACNEIVGICHNTLIERFRTLSPLGKVFIDKQLKKFIVPFSQRSAGKALRTIVRGSRLKIQEGNTIRFFIWWKEGSLNGKETGRVDLDLSSMMYDKDWNFLEHISYTNLVSDKYKAAHSGDITSAPEGDCEFIDIDINSVIEYGGRYVVMSVLSFSGHPFSALPESYTGWMIRQYPDSGEIFEPQTVQDKLDLSAETKVSIPLIIDLVQREIIWADIALASNSLLYNNVENNKRGITVMGKALCSLIKPDLYQLFYLHALARGKIVQDEQDAETVFSVEKGITPFDNDAIIANYL